MQKILLILLLSFCAFPLRAQQYRMLIKNDGEVPVVDVLRSPENTFDVARYPESHLNFPAAVLTGRNPQEILAAYVRSDSTSRRIETTRSLDGGRNWKYEPYNHTWDDNSYRTLSMYNLGTAYTPARTDSRRKTMQAVNNLLIFSGGNPILTSVSHTNGEHWNQFHSANSFGGFRITGLVRLDDGRCMALFHDDGRFLYRPEGDEGGRLRKSVIYKIYSQDGGQTWSDPQIALKHNLHGLYDAAVTYSPGWRDDDLILVASNRDGTASYISTSQDNGESWSYPEKLPHAVQGDRFGIATYKRQLIIAFRDMCRTLDNGAPNPTYGDLVMWIGDLKELARGKRHGIKVRIADNYPTGQPADFSDRMYTDCGYASVLRLGRDEVAVIAYGRWEKEQPPYIRHFLVNPSEIRRFVNSQY